MILFVNACVRKESRTLCAAKKLLSKLGDEYVEVRLSDCSFPTVDEEFLSHRDRLISLNIFDDPLFSYARTFESADVIVIAAPFWDLSFPASLKQYFEQINVLGLTFRYTPEGIPEGLCRAKKLYYVTTAGGEFFPEEYGFGYVRALAEGFYGIKDVRLFKATGLDIISSDTDALMLELLSEIDREA